MESEFRKRKEWKWVMCGCVGGGGGRDQRVHDAGGGSTVLAMIMYTIDQIQI